MLEKFIARQPIFDLRLRVFAYELLFRGGPQNAFQPYANASASVIADSITLFDLQLLTGHARAFVNVDELALRLGAPRLLPPNRIVVEILETVQPTDEILALCRGLRDAGYFFALDDFVDARTPGPSSSWLTSSRWIFSCSIPMRGNPSPPNTAARISPSSPRKSRPSATSMKPGASASPISRATSSVSRP